MIFQKSACIETLYTELPFLERFRAAGADGFEFVEFWSWTDKDLAAVRAAAEDAGVGISGFNGAVPYQPCPENGLQGLSAAFSGRRYGNRGKVRHDPLKRSGGGRKGPLPL